MLEHLPETTKAPRAPTPYPVRDWYVVAWETALRPRTLAKLSAPDDYRRGATTLIIRDEADKSRFGRELPLSEAARAALDRVCPKEGLLFGDHDRRMLLRRAAKAAGIDEYRVERISDYDFRHSRLTHLGQHSDNLAGVMYLAGHKQPATTARYLRPQKDAAAEVLRAAGKGSGGRPLTRRLRRRPLPLRGRGEEGLESRSGQGILAAFWPREILAACAGSCFPQKAKTPNHLEMAGVFSWSARRGNRTPMAVNR